MRDGAVTGIRVKRLLFVFGIWVEIRGEEISDIRQIYQSLVLRIGKQYPFGRTELCAGYTEESPVGRGSYRTHPGPGFIGIRYSLVIFPGNQPLATQQRPNRGKGITDPIPANLFLLRRRKN